MRVIAGSAKGMKLIAPKGTRTRPTSDRVREAIFGWLEDIVVEATVLDLYAGSGSLGIEALSRGARDVVFVEHDRRALGAIKTNVENTGFKDRAKIIAKDINTAVSKLYSQSNTASLVFLDPPYDIALTKLTDILELVVDMVLDEPGMIVLELPKTRLDIDFRRLHCVDTRRYGDTIVKYFVRA